METLRKHDYLYDIGLVFRSNHNYGANMTHYSLYKFLCSQGYKVLMIDVPSDSKYSLPIDRPDPLELFKDNPYNKESLAYPIKHRWDLPKMNLLCRFFIVGSDQLWRQYFVVGTNYFSTLDWVDDDKYKISYATSFGVDSYEGNYEEKKALGKRLARFQNISVRETSGVNIVSELVNKKAQCVSDPVFICDKIHFDIMAEKGKNRLPDNKYIAAYLLDRMDYKDKYVNEIGKRKGINSSILIEDAMVTHTYKIEDVIIPIENATVEEWLYMIKNCEFLVTDSFHGMCFALIFEKQFVITISQDSHRGYARVDNLLTKLELTDRIVNEYSIETVQYLSNHYIDYDVVNQKLREFAKQGRNWLIDALECADAYQNDFKRYINTHISKEVQNNIKNEKIAYDEKVKRIKENGKDILKKSCPIYVWGVGECFKKNIRLLCEIYSIAGAVDSDPNKWGEKVANNITCVSPQSLLSIGNAISVILLVENKDVAKEIGNMLEVNRVQNYITYEQLFGNT